MEKISRGRNPEKTKHNKGRGPHNVLDQHDTMPGKDGVFYCRLVDKLIRDSIKYILYEYADINKRSSNRAHQSRGKTAFFPLRWESFLKILAEREHGSVRVASSHQSLLVGPERNYLQIPWNYSLQTRYTPGCEVQS